MHACPVGRVGATPDGVGKAEIGGLSMLVRMHKANGGQSVLIICCCLAAVRAALNVHFTWRPKAGCPARLRAFTQLLATTCRRAGGALPDDAFAELPKETCDDITGRESRNDAAHFQRPPPMI